MQSFQWFTPELRHWGSGAEMQEQFRAVGAELPVELPVDDFLLGWATCEVGNVTLALPLSRPEQKPQVAQFPGSIAVVGFNEAMVGVDLDGRLVTFARHIYSPFFEFVDVGERGVVAVFETAVASVTPRGDENWRVDTELIVDWAVGDDQVVFSFDDGTRATLDLASGAWSKAPPKS